MSMVEEWSGNSSRLAGHLAAMTRPQPRPYVPGDHRHAPRTHLFVIATLCWSEGSTPVHVRNMSGKGAQVEGAALPRLGSPVVLKRGSLRVGGRVAWAAERKAGLSFESTVNVIDWMARQSNSRQDQIDEIVSALKSSAAQQKPPAARPICPGSPTMIEAELVKLRSELAQLGNTLAADIILVATHPEIQLLDIAQQRIDRIMISIERNDRRSE